MEGPHFQRNMDFKCGRLFWHLHQSLTMLLKLNVEFWKVYSLQLGREIKI